MSDTAELGRVLVTGASGIVGWSLVEALYAQGHEVRAVARNVERTRNLLPAGVDVVAGDLVDWDSLVAAVAGCGTVFHAAGMPEQWLRDPGEFHRVNVEGTHALVDAALSSTCSRSDRGSPTTSRCCSSGRCQPHTNVPSNWPIRLSSRRFRVDYRRDSSIRPRCSVPRRPAHPDSTM